MSPSVHRAKQEDYEKNPDDLTEARAIAYDLVYNGVEIGGGLRIYRRDVQEKVFKAIGMSTEEAGMFGYLLKRLYEVASRRVRHWRR